MARKRKSSEAKGVINDLIPPNSPWTQSDWWNEKSRLCRPIIQSILECLESAQKIIFVSEKDSGKKQPVFDGSPKSVLDFSQVSKDEHSKGKESKSPSSSDDIFFDRGHVKCLDENTKKVWALYHPNWGKLLNSEAIAAPWMATGGGITPDNPKELKYLVQKPPGLISHDFLSCVARFKYNRDDGDPVFPVVAASHHLKMADFRVLLLKARSVAKGRKGQKIKSLRVEMPNSKTVDLGSILQVIVDDPNGEVFVQDATDLFDAMIGFCGTVQGDGQEGWTIEHETCGDIEQLFEGWLPDNKATAESFVSLCLSSSLPKAEVSDKTATRETLVGTTPRKTAKRTVPTKATTTRKKAKRTVPTKATTTRKKAKRTIPKAT